MNFTEFFLSCDMELNNTVTIIWIYFVIFFLHFFSMNENQFLLIPFSRWRIDSMGISWRCLVKFYICMVHSILTCCSVCFVISLNQDCLFESDYFWQQVPCWQIIVCSCLPTITSSKFFVFVILKCFFIKQLLLFCKTTPPPQTSLLWLKHLKTDKCVLEQVHICKSFRFLDSSCDQKWRKNPEIILNFYFRMKL